MGSSRRTCAALLVALLVSTSQGLLAPKQVSTRSREGRVAPLHGVTKKNRFRITEKNTGGAVGRTAGRKERVSMPNRLFFANIEYDVTEAHLQPFFAAVGTVAHCKVVRDSFTGGSKGWGFVTYTESVYATNALSMLHQKLFRGRPIRLGEATSLALKRKELKATTAFEKREAKRQAAKAILEGAEEDAANEAADAAAEEAAEENPEASS